MAGYDDLPEWKRNKINKFATKRDGMEEGSNEWNRMTNKINRWSGQGGWAWSDNFNKPFGNQNTPFQKSLQDGGFDTSNFDVSNKAEVMALQKQLFPNQFNAAGEDQWDGLFGKNTKAAYENMVNQNRVASGQDAYQYEGGGGQGATPPPATPTTTHTMNSGNTITTGSNNTGNTPPAQNQNSGQSWWDWGSGVLNNLWD